MHRIDPPSAHKAGEGDRVGGVLSVSRKMIKIKDFQK
jgi:hypothetical protein